MSKLDKLIERMLMIPADFTFSELRKIMGAFGYVERNKGKTSGSRVCFYHPDTGALITLHKPHPSDKMKKAAVKEVIRFLREHGHI